MTTEEKAKAYGIALDKIKRLLGTGSNCSREDLEYVFPELAESEDERIRKALIFLIKQGEIKGTIRTYLGVSEKDILAWVEKQGEQKPVNIVTILDDYFANTPKEQQDKDWEELKHLNNFGWELSEQKPAWSEEDEKILNYLLWFYDTRFRWNDTCGDDIKFGDIVNFLKSLKERYSWKPSDEQITWLYRVADDASKDSRMKQVLNNLLSDLKKLREK